MSHIRQRIARMPYHPRLATATPAGVKLHAEMCTLMAAASHAVLRYGAAAVRCAAQLQLPLALTRGPLDAVEGSSSGVCGDGGSSSSSGLLLWEGGRCSRSGNGGGGGAPVWLVLVVVATALTGASRLASRHLFTAPVNSRASPGFVSWPTLFVRLGTSR